MKNWDGVGLEKGPMGQNPRKGAALLRRIIFIVDSIIIFIAYPTNQEITITMVFVSYT